MKTPYAIGYVWGYFLAIVAFSLLILYFLWYRLNIRYFEKRIMVEEAEILNYNFASQHRPPQISAHNELPKKYGNYYTPLSDLQLQTEDKKKMPNTISSTTPKARFCRNCGNKLWADDRFCDQCGTKVISKKN